MTEHATPTDFARWRSHAETCDINNITDETVDNVCPIYLMQ